MAVFWPKRLTTVWCLALLGVQQPASAACQLGAVAVLPLENHNGNYSIAVSINDKPVNLIFDTGAFATILSTAAANRVGVPLTDLNRQSYAIGGSQEIFGGHVRHMRIGGIEADGVSVAAQEALNALDHRALDGLFGMNMMHAYDIDIDMPGQHAILFEADGDCSKPAVALSPPLYSVPLAYNRRGLQMMIDLQIEGHPIRALIDTGAAQTALYRKTASRLGVDLSQLHADGHHVSRGAGRFLVDSIQHVFSTVKIGSFEIHNMPIEIIAQVNNGISHHHVGSLLDDAEYGEGNDEEMLLGADFMQKVHLWISHSASRLIMQYPPQPSVLPM